MTNPLEQELRELQRQEASLMKLLTCAIHERKFDKADEYKYHLDETRKKIDKILSELIR